MAKIRIYELARELNMQNKELLEKLGEIGVSAATHMSSLDSETVTKVKTVILGRDDTVDVEVTRVKPTVIRRRRKEVKKEVIELEVAPETDEDGSEKKAGAEAAETVEAEAQETAGAAAEPAEPADAKPDAAEPVAGEAADQGAEAEKETETVAEAEVEAVEAAEAVPDAGTGVETVEEAGEAAEKSGTQPATETEEPAETAKKQLKKGKKGKKEIPAKIIKLPTRSVKEAAQEAGAEKADAKEAAGETALKTRKKGKPGRAGKVVELGQTQGPDAADGDKGRKRGKVRREEPVKDRKFFKKKISFKKKEVVEGRELYQAGPARGRRPRRGEKIKRAAGQKTQITTPKAIKRRVKIDDTIVLADLAKRMGIKANEMIAKLMGMGVMATVNQTIDFDTAMLVAEEFEFEVERASFEEEVLLRTESDEPQNLAERPPVVTIMGHVDHGKTSLLDMIRKTKVTENEAGGITQHIGAYHVTTEKGRIAFLDTPGHEAFTAMRLRGAKVTDIVILVVAADDGVMPQTIEAINHSRASAVPIIVAVNKIDKANADRDRVRRELSEHGLMPEDWGGETIFVDVSAKENQGIDDLLEMILIQAEVMELKANPDKLAEGHVVEAKLDTGRGPIATVLVQGGTLKTGDSVVCGVHYGKVRALISDTGAMVESAGPSIPVEVLGLSGVPDAGDELIAVADERNAKQVSSHRLQQQRSQELAKSSRMSLEGLFEKMQEGEVKDLNLIIKADVHGSLEALRDSLTKLSNDEVKINVTQSATGTITETDVSLAAVMDAIIIGFNVRPGVKVTEMAAEENVSMRFYTVIYDVIKDLKDAILGLMSSTFEDRVLGMADVREVFHVPKIGSIAGSYITDGKMERGQLVRLLRDGVVVYEGRISSLRRFKDDVREVQSGYECGIGVENYNDIKVGDTLECYYKEEIKPELD